MIKFTEQDFRDSEQLAGIAVKMEEMNPLTLAREADEIYKHQPFLLSLFLGFKDDVTMPQLEELLRIMLLMWYFYRDKNNIKKVKITEKQ